MATEKQRRKMKRGSSLGQKLDEAYGSDGLLSGAFNSKGAEMEDVTRRKKMQKAQSNPAMPLENMLDQASR